MYKTDFDGILVTLASVEDIESRSHWVVENPDTVNYRTWRPKQGGLFCESIFWPVKNFECSCGKYKWVRYKWIVCERCGVEVTNSRVRRSRMGHIDLAVPVLHAWYRSSSTGWVHQLLWISSNEIEKILTFVKYVVVEKVDEEKRKELIARIKKDFDDRMKELDELYQQELDDKDNKISKKELDKLYIENKESLQSEFNRLKAVSSSFDFWSTLLESDYRNIFYRFVDLINFASGPESILRILRNIDVKKEIHKNVKEFVAVKSKEKKKKLIKLIKLLINLYVSGVKPENMVLRKLPVIPPDLRPVVQLDWGKFASSDVNLFYRRVLMRNIRLKKMIQVGMPDVVKKNEIRLLQESVNNLLVWEKNSVQKAWAWVKVFKSLSDMLSGKEWVFRKNLLWKRVDYSGRSIITVWPDLKLDECGLPLYIAVKIFTPFIIGKLIEKKIAYTPKQAEKLIKEESPVALKFLEEVVKDKYVLLNRAPTLHRLSIEAFKIRLMAGKTIRIHPLVCPAFNADFDGDQMAVHLPISDEAQKESAELIAADKNILKPWSGEPTITHSQDMVLWIYYLTDFFDIRYPDFNTEEEWREKNPVKWYFTSIDAVLDVFYNREFCIKDKIVVRIKWEHITTTVGRCLFNSVLPKKIRFINKKFNKKDLKTILSTIFDEFGMEETVKVADAIKDLWFLYSTVAAVSVNVLDMKVPKQKEELILIGDKKANEVYKFYFKWFLSEDEKHRLVISIWTDIKSRLESHMKQMIWSGDDLYTMVDSGARWSMSNVTQISGMKWLVVDPKWEIIELPIKWNYVEWLKPIEYFLSAHSWRKWKADTALRTAESWYLTRKLCDSSQEVIIRKHDCWTKQYIIVSKDESEMNWEDFYSFVRGRVLAENVVDVSGNVIVASGDLLDNKNVDILKDLGVDMLKIRTPLICEVSSGLCQKCYGMDLATRKIVEVGTAIWIIAAQSIWEPATQLTMKQFHSGWVAWAADMTEGIDRIKQLFEVRAPKIPAIVAPFDWEVKFTEKNKRPYLSVVSDYQRKIYIVKDGYDTIVKTSEVLGKWWVFAVKWKSSLKVSESGKIMEVHKDHIILWTQEVVSKSLLGLVPLKNIKERVSVLKWDILTAGALDIKEYQDIVWDLPTQKYIIQETKKVYKDQWQGINDKHIEVVVRQLFSRVYIEDSGDSGFVPWTNVKYQDFLHVNKLLQENWKKPAKWRRLALWLTNIAKWTDSWLSAASFQETIRVMVDASLRWAIDNLSDLKSNVIIWRLLPIWGIYRDSIDNSKNTLEIKENQ